MQIGVYGSGYLGTVISACLADFGTPVSCCHPDRTRMVEMAQGNIPFFEKNLKEIIRRNVRAGRLNIPFGEEYQTRNAIDNPLVSRSRRLIMRGVGTPFSRNQSTSDPYSGRCAE